MSPTSVSIMAGRKPAAKVRGSRVSKPKPATKVAAEKAHAVHERKVQHTEGDAPPALNEVEPVIMGVGEYEFPMRKSVQQRKTFEGESVSRPSSSREYVQMRQKEIEVGSYRRFDQDSIRVETEDGFGLVMVLKGGLWAGKSGIEMELREQSASAFRDFTRAYPPEQPSDKDGRHVDAQETEKKEWVDKGLPWGRLVRSS